MNDLTGAIASEQNEARLQDCEEYSNEMITHLQQEIIRQYQEIKRLKTRLDFNIRMGDIQNDLIQDLLELIRGRDDNSK